METNLDNLSSRFSKFKLANQTLLLTSACAGFPLERAELRGAAKIVLGYNASPKQIDLALEELVSDHYFEEKPNHLELPTKQRSFLVTESLERNLTATIFKALDQFILPLRQPKTQSFQDAELRSVHYLCRKTFLIDSKTFTDLKHKFDPYLKRHGNTWLGDLISQPCVKREDFISKALLSSVLKYTLSEGGPSAEDTCSMITELCQRCDENELPLVYSNVKEVFVATGRFDLMGQVLKRIDINTEQLAKDVAMEHLAFGRLDEAVASYEKGLSIKRLPGKHLIPVYEDTWGMLYSLTLLLRQKPGDLEKVENALNLPPNRLVLGTYRSLKALLQFAKRDFEGSKTTLSDQRFINHPDHLLGVFLQAFAELTVLGDCENCRQQLKKSDFLENHRLSHPWWVKEIEYLIKVRKKGLRLRNNKASLIRPFPKSKVKWDLSLDGMERLLQLNDPTTPSRSQKKIGWVFRTNEQQQPYDLYPVEVTLKNDVWKMTNDNLSLKNLRERHNHPYAEEQDVLAFRTIRFNQDSSEYDGRIGEHYVQLDEAIPHLIKHPHLFLEEQMKPIELQAQKLSLIIEQDSEGIRMSVDPPFREGQQFTIETTNSEAWTYTYLTERQRDILNHLPLNTPLPIKHKKRLDRIITELSKCMDIKDLRNLRKTEPKSASPPPRANETTVS